MPLKRSLNTVIIPVPVISAAVTGVPLNEVSERVVPFRVMVTGSVPVVPSGIAFYIRTVKYPTGGMRLKPKAKSTAVSVTVTLVVLK